MMAEIHVYNVSNKSARLKVNKQFRELTAEQVSGACEVLEQFAKGSLPFGSIEVSNEYKETVSKNQRAVASWIAHGALDTLHRAAELGEVNSMRILISHFFTPNVTDVRENSCLHLAAYNGHADAVRYLLEAKADVNTVNENGETALFNACANGHIEVATLLLDHDANSSIPDNSGWLPIDAASLFGEYEVIQGLYTSFGPQKIRMSPWVLKMASFSGSLRLVDYLHDLGAGVNESEADGVTAIHEACTADSSISIAKYLLDHGADLNRPNSLGVLPLTTAITQGHSKFYPLLEHDDEQGRSPVHWAAGRGGKEIISFVTKEHPSRRRLTNKRDKQGRLPIHYACYYNQETLVLMLVDTGSDLSLCDVTGVTAFHLLCAFGSPSAIQSVISRVHTELSAMLDVSGRSPLHYACTRRNPSTEVTKAIVERSQRSAVNAPDNEGNLPLHEAIGHGSVEVAQFLISAGANLSVPLPQGESVVYKAVCRGLPSLIEHMLQHGGDINQANQYGETPLSAAIDNNHDDILFRLLSHGCEFPAALAGIAHVTATVHTLLAWAGSAQDASLTSLQADFTTRGVEFLFQIHQANFPMSFYSEIGIEKIIDKLEYLDLSVLKQITLVKQLLNKHQFTFPSLTSIARGAIRNHWEHEARSILYKASRFNDARTTQETWKYIFLYEEALVGLAEYADEISDLFQFRVYYSNMRVKRLAADFRVGGDHSSAKKRRLVDEHMRYAATKGQHGMPQVTEHGQNKLDGPTSMSALHMALSYSTISYHPNWILNKMALLCPNECTRRSNIDTPPGESSDLVYLERAVHVCQEAHTTFSTTIEEVLRKYLSLLSTGTNTSWDLHGCGSFYNDNKVGNFDELDYLVVLQSSDIKIDSDTINGLEMRGEIPLHILHRLPLHPKQYLYEGLRYYLREEWRPDDTGSGRVYVRSVYPHPRGPGVCVQLAWVCEEGHTHNLGVDLTMCVLWPGRTLNDVTSFSEHFTSHPFVAARNSLEQLPVLLVPTRNMITKVVNDNVVSTWKVSYNHTKKAIFECVDSVAPNVRKAFRLAKYIREFFPKKLKYSESGADLQGSWKDSPLFSSYVLYNVLLGEVVANPDSICWNDEQLPTRLISVLAQLKSWTFVDFFKDRREDSISLSGLNALQKTSVKDLVERDIDHVIATLHGVRTTTSRHSTDVTMASQVEKCEEKVLALEFDSSTGHVTYHPLAEGTFRFDTSAVRGRLHLAARDDVYYYSLPQPVTGRSLVGISLVTRLMRKFESAYAKLARSSLVY